MDLDNSRSIFYLPLHKALFCAIIYLWENFNSPVGPVPVGPVPVGPVWGSFSSLTCLLIYVFQLSNLTYSQLIMIIVIN